MLTTARDPRSALAADPRTRPFHDLFARVPDLPARPARIADLGCGDGTLTTLLAARWPDAHITGIDSSADQLGRAQQHAGETPGGGRIDFTLADLSVWRPGEPFDLIISNAAIQWVPGQTDRFATWTRTLGPGGVFAFQVPDNAAAASHAVLRDLCTGPRWHDRLGESVLHAFEVYSPADYLDRLSALGFEGDAWETVYAHVLPRDDPFRGWINGTGMLPIEAALADDREAREEFMATYRDRLREAYPARPYGTVFPFRRVFAVARKRDTDGRPA